MLLHSHTPAHLSLLPALPPELSDFGRVQRLRCRGGAAVALHWAGGVLRQASLEFPHPHPWLAGVQEDRDHAGFARVPASFARAELEDAPGGSPSGSGGAARSAVAYEISYDAPNAMRYADSTAATGDGAGPVGINPAGAGPCAEEIPAGEGGEAPSGAGARGRFRGALRVLSFPCSVTLVAALP
jgi:hypothetical protein